MSSQPRMVNPCHRSTLCRNSQEPKGVMTLGYL